jgi:hypothetical protein
MALVLPVLFDTRFAFDSPLDATVRYVDLRCSGSSRSGELSIFRVLGFLWSLKFLSMESSCVDILRISLKICAMIDVLTISFYSLNPDFYCICWCIRYERF